VDKKSRRGAWWNRK